MPTLIAIPTSVPAAEQAFVDDLRAFIKDTVALNVLEQAQENTDLELYRFIIQGLDEINGAYQPITTYTMSDPQPQWTLLKKAAIIQVLVANGIWSARNTLTFSDSGGVTIQDYDKYGRYINFYNSLVRNYTMSVSAFKKSANIDDCYGGVNSEYNYASGYGYYYYYY